MKQGTNFVLPVKFNLNLGDVERIDFIFKQGSVTKEYSYPSDKAVRSGDEIRLVWDAQDTYLFKPSVLIEMDSKVYMKDSDDNPDTPILKFYLKRTLFKDVSADG